MKRENIPLNASENKPLALDSAAFDADSSSSAKFSLCDSSLTLDCVSMSSTSDSSLTGVFWLGFVLEVPLVVERVELFGTLLFDFISLEKRSRNCKTFPSL